MKTKLLSLMLVTLFGILLVTPLVSSFFPISHKYQTDELLSTYEGDSGFYEACKRHPDACYVANVLTDISVIWYYVDGGENYIITHTPSFARAMLRNHVGEVELACAIGSGLHSTQDYQSHNLMVPESITRTGIPNSVIHVFAEQRVDNFVEDTYPSIVDEVALLEEGSWEKCIPLIKRTLGDFSAYDDEIQSGKLDDVIYTFVEEVQGSIANQNTGYDPSFKNKVSFFGKLSFVPLSFLIAYLGLTFLFLILFILLVFRKKKTTVNWISIVIFGILGFALLFIFFLSIFGNAFNTLVFVIKPISGLVPVGNMDTHLTQSVQNGIDFFDQGEQWLINHEKPDASGLGPDGALTQADEESTFMLYLLIGIVIFLLGFLIYLNFRRKDIKGAFKL